MGTTTKMAIPYPEATGLVKDGWEDMKDIATQVDAKSGLVLINTTSFNAVSSQSINDVFSSTFLNYVVYFNISNTNNTDLVFRYRVSGSDNSTLNYNTHMMDIRTSSASYFGNNAASTDKHFFSSSNGTDSVKSGEIKIFNPFATDRTLFSSQHIYSSTSGASQYIGGTNIGGFNATTSFTGFTMFPNAGTMTGSLSVFGVNK